MGHQSTLDEELRIARYTCSGSACLISKVLVNGTMYETEGGSLLPLTQEAHQDYSRYCRPLPEYPFDSPGSGKVCIFSVAVSVVI